MPSTLADFNGVFALSEGLVNKLLTEQMYDPNLLGQPGSVPNEDFKAVPLGVGPTGDGAKLYLLLGRPTITFLTHDPNTNAVALTVPLLNLVAFQPTADGKVERIVSSDRLAVTLRNLKVTSTDTALTIDTSAITVHDVEIDWTTAHPGITGVGGWAEVNGEFDDAQLNNLLAKAGKTADDLRLLIALFVRDGGLGVATDIPLTVGGDGSPLGKYKVALFDREGDGTAELLLFAANGTGKGNPAKAVDIIPRGNSPRFGFTLALRGQVLLDLIGNALDQDYYSQNDSFAQDEDQKKDPLKPLNRLGHMVVPSAGTAAFALPKQAVGSIKVGAPANGSVQITIAAGGLRPNAEAHITRLDVGEIIRFTAAKDASATVSFKAAENERLALTIDALSMPGEPDYVVWRPEFRLADGLVHVSSRYKYVPLFKAEEDLELRIKLVPDPSAPFKIHSMIVYSKYDLPWGLTLVDLLFPLMFAGIFGFVGQMTLPTIAENLLQFLIDPKAKGAVSGRVDDLNEQLRATSPEDVKLFLEQIDVSEESLMLSGHGDAGAIRSYDRTIIANGTVERGLWSDSDYVETLNIDWANRVISFRFQPAFVVKEGSADEPYVARTEFWKATYDDRPADAQFTASSVALPLGTTSMIWTKTANGHAKVLFEWAKTVDPELQVSWVAYQERATRAVLVETNIKSKVVGGRWTEFFTYEEYAYHGTIDLVPVKFFLTEETVKLDQEHWFWDDQPVPAQGLTFPGGSILVDAPNHRLILDVNQTKLPEADVPTLHRVRFEGTDVFGVALSGEQIVRLPARDSRPVGPGPVIGPHGPIDPLGPDNPDIRQLSLTVAAALGQLGKTPSGQQLAGTLAVAIRTGSAQLEAASALAFLGSLSAGGGRKV